MEKAIYYISGNKGGVGKSVIGLSFLDYLLALGEKPLLIETDTGNPDVGQTYKGLVETVFLDLDERENWLALSEKIQNLAGDRPAVISCGARSNLAFKQSGTQFLFALAEMLRPFETLWPINRGRDSVSALAEYLGYLGTAGRIHVIRNLYYGTREKFELFNNSKTREKVLATGGTVLDFPDLADRVYDTLNRSRLPIAAGIEPARLLIADRLELENWRAGAWRMFDSAFAAPSDDLREKRVAGSDVVPDADDVGDL